MSMSNFPTEPENLMELLVAPLIESHHDLTSEKAEYELYEKTLNVDIFLRGISVVSVARNLKTVTS